MSKLDTYAEKASWFTPETKVIALAVAKSLLSDIVDAVQESHNQHVSRLTAERLRLQAENEKLRIGLGSIRAYTQDLGVVERANLALGGNDAN